ncbi:MAG: hypothetical protein ABEJ91_02450 [Candidatus Nanohaloarchaea archaeon]
MSTLEHRHSGAELMDPVDEIAGYADILDVRLDSYEATLGDFLDGDAGHGNLEQEISGVEAGLRRTFETVMELDALVAEENMVTFVQRNGDSGVFNFSSAYSQLRFSGGLDKFRDLVTVCYFIQDDSSDVKVPREPLNGDEYCAPTAAVKNAGHIVDAFEKLDEQYERVIELEEASRRHFTADGLEPYDPQPPVHRLLGGEYDEKARNLNREVG